MLVEVSVAVLNFYPVNELVRLAPGKGERYEFVFAAFEVVEYC
jgi:hypothetical protein